MHNTLRKLLYDWLVATCCTTYIKVGGVRTCVILYKKPSCR